MIKWYTRWLSEAGDLLGANMAAVAGAREASRFAAHVSARGRQP